MRPVVALPIFGPRPYLCTYSGVCKVRHRQSVGGVPIVDLPDLATAGVPPPVVTDIPTSPFFGPAPTLLTIVLSHHRQWRLLSDLTTSRVRPLSDLRPCPDLRPGSVPVLVSGRNCAPSFLHPYLFVTLVPWPLRLSAYFSGHRRRTSVRLSTAFPPGRTFVKFAPPYYFNGGTSVPVVSVIRWVNH